MKKLLCLFLVICMLTGLCGCFGGAEDSDIRGDIVTAAPQEDETTEADATTVPEETENEVSLGHTDSNRYQNDFLGISCTLPGDWTFYSDEQIRELNNIAMDAIGEEYAQAIENAAILYDMYAMDQSGLCSMNVNMEKWSAAQVLLLDVKTVIENQIPEMESALTNMGYTDVHAEYAKITVDGKEFDGSRITAKIQDVDYYMVQFSFKKGMYMANVTIGSLATDETDTLLSYYSVS